MCLTPEREESENQGHSLNQGYGLGEPLTNCFEKSNFKPFILVHI